jgi:hypothetical protein
MRNLTNSLILRIDSKITLSSQAIKKKGMSWKVDNQGNIIPQNKTKTGAESPAPPAIHAALAEA